MSSILPDSDVYLAKYLLPLDLFLSFARGNLPGSRDSGIKHNWENEALSG